MLGIETTTSKKLPIPPERTLAQFHEFGVKIVNCALLGCMYTRKIRAFFVVYGYSVPQDTEVLVDNIETVRMNDDILNKEIVLEQLANQKRTERDDAAHRRNGGGYI